mmetsp:Transcript_33852/g.79129  ORF Transcript_33852/g.79129 Transcript_33852/m.79129 type:complete len:377 (+) Transcript_33852:101-1231(+)
MWKEGGDGIASFLRNASLEAAGGVQNGNSCINTRQPQAPPTLTRVLLKELPSSYTNVDIETILAENGFAGTYTECKVFLQLEDDNLTAQALIYFNSDECADEFALVWNSSQSRTPTPTGNTDPQWGSDASCSSQPLQTRMLSGQSRSETEMAGSTPPSSYELRPQRPQNLQGRQAVEEEEHPQQRTVSCTPEEILSNMYTSLMIQNLPYRISQQDVRDFIDEAGYSEAYDFFHLPHSVRAGISHGYAFINFLDSQVAARFAQQFAGSLALTTQTHRKPLCIAPATVQGFDALVGQCTRRKLHRIRNPRFRPFIRKPMSATDTADQSSSSPWPHQPTDWIDAGAPRQDGVAGGIHSAGSERVDAAYAAPHEGLQWHQ